MVILKKLTFAPFFLLSFAYLLFLTVQFLKNSNSGINISVEFFVAFLILVVMCLVVGFFFVVFCTLSQDWKLVLPVSLLGSLLPFVFLDLNFGLFLAVICFLSFLAIFATLENKLKTYITFQPSVLLSSPIRNTACLIAVGISLIYFLTISASIKANGLQLPDSTIDLLQNVFSPKQSNQISPEQLDLIKNNPQLLQGTGYSLQDIENVAKSGTNATANPAVRETIKKTFQSFLQPYLAYIAPVLGLLFVLNFISTIVFVSILLPIPLWLLFWILRTTGFVKFVTEMREVKKLVV
jgi:hypothetical protein